MLKFESKIIEKKDNKPIKWNLTIDNGFDTWTMELNKDEMFALNKVLKDSVLPLTAKAEGICTQIL